MSVITNKDRITENNDKISRLIELVKQVPTNNPKQAATEAEMAAMITDKNIGKVVKYLGESGDKYEKDALYIIAEGDETDSGLFARRLNITEGSLSITENGTYDVTNKASVDVNVAGGGGSDSTKLALVVGVQSKDTPYDITASDLEGVTVLGDYAFYQMKGLKSMELPETCTSIGGGAFQSCTSLTSIDMPSATSIGESAFQSCTSLKSISMPNVTSIGNYAFLSCTSLMFVSMPSVTSIGDGAFRSCSILSSLTIPSTCTSIGSYALECGYTSSQLTFIFEGTTPPSIQSTTFYARYIKKIIVPKGCGEAYKTATNWGTFARFIEEATE